MAPRTRSNRAEKLSNERLIARGIVLNSHGFPALPNELYSEILSHLDAMPVPQFVRKEKSDPYRQVTLLALSQTCRAFRSFFLRHAWERIEVFGGMWTPAGMLTTEEEDGKRGWEKRKIMDKKFADETLRQLETVTVRNPELRQYVRIVNVMFVNLAHKDAVLPEIAESLSLLPHVHTLQLTTRYYTSVTTFFSEFTYPKIHTLSLQGFRCGDILLSCPNLITFNNYGDFSSHELLRTCAHDIEVLGVLSTYSRLALPLDEIVRSFPRLRDISIDKTVLRIYQDDVSCLSSLPLHTLRIRMDRSGWLDPISGVEFFNEFQRWIELAKIILKACPIREADIEKRVVVVNEDQSVVTYPIP